MLGQPKGASRSQTHIQSDCDQIQDGFDRRQNQGGHQCPNESDDALAGKGKGQPRLDYRMRPTIICNQNHKVNIPKMDLVRSQRDNFQPQELARHWDRFKLPYELKDEELNRLRGYYQNP